jgi:hypothetical protein
MVEPVRIRLCDEKALFSILGNDQIITTDTMSLDGVRVSRAWPHPETAMRPDIILLSGCQKASKK